MIVGILSEMVDDHVAPATVLTEEKPATQVTETAEIETGMIPDITEVDLRKQLLLKGAKDPEGLLKMKAYTPARLGVGRTGTRYLTPSTLRFRADHAAAQDAVFFRCQ